MGQPLSDDQVHRLQKLLGGPKPEPTPTPPPPSKGKLGKYTLLRMLGQQSWEVSEGHHPTPLVLRLLGKTQDDEVTATACGDLRPLAALKHPVIVNYHKLSTISDGYFTVRDFVPGSSLELLILEPTAALHVFYEVARAIQFAHEHGVVHGAITSSNIILMTNGRPMVVDFAIRQLQSRFNPSLATGTPTPEGDLDTLSLLFISLVSGKTLSDVRSGVPCLARRIHPAVDKVINAIIATRAANVRELADLSAKAIQHLPMKRSSGLLERYKQRD